MTLAAIAWRRRRNSAAGLLGGQLAVVELDQIAAVVVAGSIDCRKHGLEAASLCEGSGTTGGILVVNSVRPVGGAKTGLRTWAQNPVTDQ
jgi:hypothetical protein